MTQFGLHAEHVLGIQTAVSLVAMVGLIEIAGEKYISERASYGAVAVFNELRIVHDVPQSTV